MSRIMGFPLKTPGRAGTHYRSSSFLVDISVLQSFWFAGVLVSNAGRSTAGCSRFSAFPALNRVWTLAF